MSDGGYNGTIGGEGASFEQHKASRDAAVAADPIHWTRSSSYRNSPYRHLHHQRGICGHFDVRLLEASDLKRSHWSALALGPVKYLGLSTAHGEVSSYVTVRLGFTEASGGGGAGCGDGDDPHRNSGAADSSSVSGSSARTSSLSSTPLSGVPPSPVTPSVASFGEASFSSSAASTSSFPVPASVTADESFRSTVVPHNSNPRWSQGDERCRFRVPLKKAALPRDGMRIALHIRVDEEAAAAEKMIPSGLVPGVGVGSLSLRGIASDDRLIGRGEVDLTPLCLGEEGLAVARGSPDDGDGASRAAQLGLLDVWVPLCPPSAASSSAASARPGQSDTDCNGNKNDHGASTTGRVHLLISFEPFGMEPRRNDVVALESFARRPMNSSSCRPVLPPLRPLRVVDRRGPYLLVRYTVPSLSSGGAGRTGNRKERVHCIRLHRNAVFVVERTTLIDAAVDLALKPSDLVLSTPLGRDAVDLAQPYASAAGELVTPALLSARLLLAAGKTGLQASLVGARAGMDAVVAAGQEEALRDGQTGRRFDSGSRSV